MDLTTDRTLPAGQKLGKLLRQVLRRQQGEVMTRLRQGNRRAPSLDHWTKPMVELFLPVVSDYFQQGGQDAARRLNRLLARRPPRKNYLLRNGEFYWKDTPAIPPHIAFDIFHPRVADAIQRLTFDFCDSTNRTSTMLLSEAIKKLRQELFEGLAEGEAVDTLGQRVQQIFDDPNRAYRIARTEANRAVHSAQLMAAKDSGIVSAKRWLAKSDACPQFCLPLAGKVVGLDEDFAFDPGAGAYSHVPHPPRHPHCTCTWVEVIDSRWLPTALQTAQAG